jgi:hypothetical protein
MEKGGINACHSASHPLKGTQIYFLGDSMTFSLLLLTLSQYSMPNNTNEGQVQACIQTCQAFADQPNYDLKGCIVKCQELARP